MLLKLEATTNPLVRNGIYSYTIGKLLEGGTLVESEKRQSDIFAINVLTYLELHYSEDLSLEKAAFALGYNKCYFSSVFKKIFRKGFCEYLSMLRVKKSLRMLEENCSISDAAYAVGFGSMQSYYTNFKKIMGSTPKAYLSQNKYPPV